MASIQRIVSPVTEAVSYRAQVRVRGRPAQSETFAKRKDAKEWADSIESAILENRHFPNRQAMRTTFAEAAVRYRSAALKDLKSSTRRAREDHLDWWVKRFAGLTLPEVTPDRISAARDELANGTYRRAKPRKDKDGNQIIPKEYPRSGATVNRYLASLSHLFTVSVREWRLLNRNPVAEISKKRESRGRVRFLADDERTKLLDACARSEWTPLYALVLLALTTGARRGELIRLKWCDIDLTPAAPRATVRDTKNGDPRVLPLVGKALDAIRELKLRGSARSDYVFPTPSGLPGPFDHFDSHWYDALEAAGIEDFKFHDLRHSCASYLAAQGASLLEIADTLGHRSMSMVRRYSHLAQSHKVSVVERMAKAKGL